jgi:hypothetical protein
LTVSSRHQALLSKVPEGAGGRAGRYISYQSSQHRQCVHEQETPRPNNRVILWIYPPELKDPPELKYRKQNCEDELKR